MGDTVFRPAQPPVEDSQPHNQESTPAQTSSVSVEVPYLDYEKTAGHPHTVDYFELGDMWADPDGGFSKEVSLIEEYLSSKISNGELLNDQKAVKDFLKKMEKTNNLHTESNKIVRIETLAEYVKFLMKTDKIKFNMKRYAYR